MRSLGCAFFFFSSRRRQTRLQGDWNSDVCSSDVSRPIREDEKNCIHDRAARSMDRARAFRHLWRRAVLLIDRTGLAEARVRGVESSGLEFGLSPAMVPAPAALTSVRRIS